MYAFTFDPVTRAYAGGVPCDFDQLTPGAPLLPAFSMLKGPPPGALEKPGFWLFANANADDWELREVPPPAEVRPPSVAELREAVDHHMQNLRNLLAELERREAPAP